jgi:hypothetical protein
MYHKEAAIDRAKGVSEDFRLADANAEALCALLSCRQSPKIVAGRRCSQVGEANAPYGSVD